MLPDRNSASQSWPVSLCRLEQYPKVGWNTQPAIAKQISAFSISHCLTHRLELLVPLLNLDLVCCTFLL